MESETELTELVSSKSINIGIHRPKKPADVSTLDFNLDKYKGLPLNQIYLDPRPRIKNIIKELEEEHQWAWPPQPPKDFEKARIMKRRKCPALYNKECLDLCSVLSLIIGPWELLIALGFMILPKTFISAMRESSIFCILFTGIFLIEGAFHTYAAILGFGLRSMRPYMIGFTFPSWPFEFILPLLGLFVTFVGFYTSQRWRILKEMTDHLKGYTYHWYSKSHWDRYQGMMHCCGIDGYEDWKYHGPVLEEADGNIASVPRSCCVEENCWKNSNNTGSGVYSNGCMDITIMGTNTLFISSTICMLVALFLSVIGYRSMRESEDFVGDPIHNLLFDSNSSTAFRKTNRAFRRDELFALLNYYTLILGEELGFDEEVKAVKEYLGVVSEENEQQPPPKDGNDKGDSGVVETIPKNPPENNLESNPEDENKSSEEGKDSPKEKNELKPNNEEELEIPKWDNSMPEELPSKGMEIDSEPLNVINEFSKIPEVTLDTESSDSDMSDLVLDEPSMQQKSEELSKILDADIKAKKPPETQTEILLPKNSSLMLSASAMEWAIPPEDNNKKPEPNLAQIEEIEKSHSSLISLIPVINPSELVQIQDLSLQIETSNLASRVDLEQSKGQLNSDESPYRGGEEDIDNN